MNKLTKILVVVASSLSLSFASLAGELSVSGSANASYLINGGQNNDDSGLGISNELNFKASGELDNGFTWNYHTELDPNAAGTTDNDDSGLVIGMGDLGTAAIYDSEGGLSAELAYGIGALGTGNDYANTWGATGNTASAWGFDVSGHPNVQYHLPADLLPYGITVKLGYAPNTADGDSNSFKSTGGVNGQGADGNGAQQIRVDAAPIDGLKLAVDYIDYTGNSGGANDQLKTGGNISVQYAMGNFKVGIMEGYTEDGVGSYANGDGTSFDRQETSIMGIEFAINDNLSVSYQEEDHKATDKGTIAVAATTKTKTTTTMESEIAQIAYNVGGATVGIFVNETENSDFVVGKKEKKTIFHLGMEF